GDVRFGSSPFCPSIETCDQRQIWTSPIWFEACDPLDLRPGMWTVVSIQFETCDALSGQCGPSIVTAGCVPALQPRDAFRHLKLNPNRGDGTMRYETGTFELRDNDMMMRELSSAETDEVVGGVGTAEVIALTRSGAGSTLTSSG